MGRVKPGIGLRTGPKVRVNLADVEAVEKIEGFYFEVEPLVLADRKVLHHAQVDSCKARSVKRVKPGGARTAGRDGFGLSRVP